MVIADTNLQDRFASDFTLTIVPSCKEHNEYYQFNSQYLKEILCLPFSPGWLNRRGFHNAHAQQEVQTIVRVKVAT